MSEGWALQLAAKNIGVSILCPGFVKTRIHESQRNRQSQYGTPATPALASERQEMAAMMVNNGIPVEPVANRVVEAIRDNDLYVFTHIEFRGLVEARMNMALAAFDKSAKSKALSVLSDRAVSSMLMQPNK
jgi:short-subunit dehydrogenase